MRGRGTFSQRLAPVQASGVTGAEAVAAGDSVSFAIKSAGGTLWSWGWGFFGQLGSGARIDNATTPVQVSNRVDANLIGPGSFHGSRGSGSCAAPRSKITTARTVTYYFAGHVFSKSAYRPIPRVWTLAESWGAATGRECSPSVNQAGLAVPGRQVRWCVASLGEPSCAKSA